MVVLSVLGVAACQQERAHSYLHLSHPAPPRCAHHVVLIRPDEPVLKTYRELASISVTCGALAPEDCDMSLLARGCDLGADAVWVKSSSYVAGARHGRSSESGVALEYTAPTPPAAATN